MIEAEEKILKDRFGKKQPFSVPDGYFDRFATDMMDRLPVTPVTVHVPVWHLWRKVAVAAAFVGIVATASLAVLKGSGALDAPVTAKKVPAAPASGSILYESSTLDMAADYAMLDNDDIYAMVSENQ